MSSKKFNVHNMSIKSRLILSFVIVALLAGAVGAVGLYTLNAVDKVGVEITQNHTLPLIHLSHYIDNYQRSRAELRELLLEDSLAGRNEIVGNIDKLDKAQDEALDSFVELTDGKDPVALAIVDQLRSAIDTYRMKRVHIIEAGLLFTEEGDDYAFDELGDVDYIKTTNEIQALTNQLQKEKGDAVVDRSEDQIHTSTTAMTAVVVVIIAAVLLAVALGLIISFEITQVTNRVLRSVQKIAKGDLATRIGDCGKNELGLLASEVDSMAAGISAVIEQVRDAALLVDGAAQQVSSSSMSLAQVATEQASSSQQISASLTQIAAQTKDNADNSAKAMEISNDAKNGAQKGNAQMSEMLRAMSAINIASEKISNIIKVIEDIAFQTNILALNAAVEAARAGSHGRGFAVVAEEVRNLAARSAKAASETTQMIVGSSREVEGGTKIANDTARALTEIVNGVTSSAEIVSKISQASSEQSMGIEQINVGVEQVSQAIQTTSSVAQETASASSEMSTQASNLMKLISRFKIGSAEAGLEGSHSAKAAVSARSSAPRGAFAAAHGGERLGDSPVPALAVADFGKY